MSTKTKRGKCAKCLPDSNGAILTASYRGDDRVWKCSNCGHTTPRYSITPSNTITPSQKLVIERLERAGWTVAVEMIGRKVFVRGNNDRGSVTMNLFAGDSFYGTIGPRGAYEIKLQRFGGDKLIEDETRIYVYLEGK